MEVAISVAQRFIDYQGYGRDIKVAQRALKRRVPGYSDRKYQNALEKAMLHYRQSMAFVKKNEGRFWRNFNKYKDDQDISGCYVGLDRPFWKTQKGLRLRTVRATLAWVFYLHHMR